MFEIFILFPYVWLWMSTSWSKLGLYPRNWPGQIWWRNVKPVTDQWDSQIGLVKSHIKCRSVWSKPATVKKLKILPKFNKDLIEFSEISPNLEEISSVRATSWSSFVGSLVGLDTPMFDYVFIFSFTIHLY